MKTKLDAVRKRWGKRNGKECDCRDCEDMRYFLSLVDDLAAALVAFTYLKVTHPQMWHSKAETALARLREKGEGE